MNTRNTGGRSKIKSRERIASSPQRELIASPTQYAESLGIIEISQNEMAARVEAGESPTITRLSNMQQYTEDLFRPLATDNPNTVPEFELAPVPSRVEVREGQADLDRLLAVEENPDLRAKLREELQEVLPSPATWLETENLALGGTRPIDVIAEGQGELILDRLRGVKYSALS